jgi:hypothetical protein
MKKCKKVLWMAALGLVLSVTEGRAQSIGQLITQLSYDIQKVKELKKILQEMYQSYEIIDKGYTDIRNIVEGNFDLHKTFLDALLAISPTVAGYARIGKIINTEATLVKEYQAGMSRFNADGYFSAAELDYMSSLYEVLLDRGERALDELAMVTTAGQLRMSDAERLGAIDRIYGDLTGDLSLLRQFNNATSIQAIQRARAAGDIGTLRSIYGIIE